MIYLANLVKYSLGNEREATEKEHLLVYDDSDTGKEDNQVEDRCSEVHTFST